jgi:isopenicillin N synthase-like dioxygenase
MSELVPVIDIEGWFSGDEAAKRRIAREIDAACRGSGFFQIVGHGIDEGLRQEVKDVADEFFELPEEEKRRYEPASRDINRGYSGRMTESLSYSTGVVRPPDLAEAFIIGNDRVVDGDPYFEAERHRSFAANIWPSRPPRMRNVLGSYFLAVEELSHELCNVAAMALGLEADFFVGRTDKAIATLRCNWYQRNADELVLPDDQMALGAHTDYGILTILMVDAVPGLQVIARDDQWHDVLPLAEGFVVNIGDALELWTNDEWTSTIHRVVPSPLPGAQRRRSFAFFQDGNYDAVIECLPTCTSADRPPRYAPITLGNHVIDKIVGGRALTTLKSAVQTTGNRLGVREGD